MTDGPYRVVVSQWAIQQIHNGFNWYEHEKEGLGQVFMNEIDTYIRQIAAQPHIYSLINTKFRWAKMSRFPYVIIYQVKGAVVLIAAVRHTKQKPVKRYGA